MSGRDKASNKAQKAKGKIKEVAGRGTGDRALENQGKDDQRAADMKDAGEKVKDAVRPKGSGRLR
ncbi:CsbD family protein [Mycobacterium sp.]|jgi:uncharacterized protein YjbJ (UPF0337 family)|uniref:CsbD family protein n=1 Tax=Mycobacterium sp. TaxID=1785 RepID=UPI002D2A5136|nr:CsbD family protein [Mycobacterium sp.]HZA09828.1 CsbD family protein [Mycobacterium sp.]